MQCPNCHTELNIAITSAGRRASIPAAAADASDVGDLLSMIDDGALNAWEAGFVSDLRKRFLQYGGKIRISEKQLGKLRAIATGEKEERF